MKEKSLNIEEILHVGNKKAKQLRDVRQALWAYINDDELMPKDLNFNAIKPCLDKLDEDDKAVLEILEKDFNFCKFYPLNEYPNIMLCNNGCMCGSECDDFSDCTCDDDLADDVKSISSLIDSLISDLQLEICRFYHVKNSIIEKLFKANHFELVGYHVSEDTGNELLYFRGEKYTFHLPIDKSNLDVDVDEVEYLGEIDIVPSNEPASEYSTLKLEEITRLLENYL